MKAIITSWIYPHETKYGADERPKSIERISTTIKDLKEHMNTAQLGACFGDTIEFASNIATFDEPEIFADTDEIKRFWNGDGYAYLENCLKNNDLGRCVARVYSSKTYEKRLKAGKDIQYHYYLFQVRNIH